MSTSDGIEGLILDDAWQRTAFEVLSRSPEYRTEAIRMLEKTVLRWNTKRMI